MTDFTGKQSICHKIFFLDFFLNGRLGCFQLFSVYCIAFICMHTHRVETWPRSQSYKTFSEQIYTHFSKARLFHYCTLFFL